MQEISFGFTAPTDMRFGVGALEQVALELPRRGWNRVFVVTDAGIRRTGLLQKLQDVLNGAGTDYKIFDGVQPNPLVQTIEDAALQANDFRPDALIGFGGGSSLDAAKLVTLLLTHGKSVLDYEGSDTVPGPCKPLIAIPTTAGTGSEVTIFAVASDPSKKQKLVVASSYLIPTLALVDPQLSATMPPALTAATGLDALTHAIESTTSLAAQPIVDVLALEAIKLIRENLPKVVQHGSDMEARAKLAYASLLGGLAISNAYVGVAHALAHALGGVYDLPHGVCCAMALPAAIEFNRETKAEKYERIAQAFGARSAGELAEGVRKFNHSVQIPQRLRELGVPESALGEIAQRALQDGSVLFNPRPVTEADMKELLQTIY